MKNSKTKSDNLMKTKQMVRSMITSRLEPKIYASVTSGSTTVAGATFHALGIPQGDGLSERSGLQIRPSHINVRITTIGAGNFVTRFILVQDRLNVATIPAVGDILATAIVNSTHNIVNQLNNRFKYLHDTTLTLSNAGEQVRFSQIEIPMKGIIGYTGTGSTSASSGVNAIYLLVIADSATPTYDYRLQMHFTDA